MNKQKLFVCGVALMVAWLFAAGTGSAATLSNTASTNWNYNTTPSFSGSKWIDNADTFYASQSIVVNVDNTYGQVGAYGIIINIHGGTIFSNQMLQIGAGGCQCQTRQD